MCDAAAKVLHTSSHSGSRSLLPSWTVLRAGYRLAEYRRVVSFSVVDLLLTLGISKLILEKHDLVVLWELWK